MSIHYAGVETLNAMVENIKNLFATKTHTHSWNEIENRPFYDETVVMLEWDGDTTGLEYVEITLDGVTMPFLYKVSDKTFTKEELIGAEATISTSEGNQIYLIDSESITEEGIDVIGAGRFAYIAMSDEAKIPFDGTTGYLYLSKGIWCPNPEITEGVYATSLSKESFKQLDEKFIPVLITTDDIDTICGGSIQYAEEIMF